MTNHFTVRQHSPFRYDIVGSFLRPESLKQARTQFQAGQINQDQLKSVEDQCIIDLLQQEEQVGLHAVTDGEFRRSWWHLDFFWGLNGVTKQSAPNGYQFHDETTRAETATLTGKINGQQHPFIQHFQFVQDHVHEQTQVKQTIPAPSQFWAELQRPENQAAVHQFYADTDSLLTDIAQAYQQVIQDLYDAGCRTLQLDDCTWGALADWQTHPEHVAYGIDPQNLADLKQTYLQLNNAAISQAPQDLVINTHICRGNYHSTWANSGGYDSVADPLFTDENVQAYYLEYDSERAGSFEPLQQVASNKLVVLGLVTSKSGTLEDKATIIQRIHEASQYVDLDRLAVSPQCGFASTEEGNILTAEQQWQKIKLLKEIAQEVWSDEN